MCSQESLISVIVPVYRVERYLDRCVESIVDQTYRNLEIILIDDGSPDGCPEICDRWAKKDARIVVIHQENRGVSAARNAGVAIARGAYIGFIDSDDFVRPDYFETLYSALVSNHAEMSICMRSTVDEEGFAIPRYLMRMSHKPGVYTGRELLTAGFVFTVWGALFTAGLCRKETFREDLSFGEDTCYIISLIVDCRAIAVTNKKLYLYTQRDESAMGGLRQRVDEKALAERISVSIELYRLLKSRDLQNLTFRILYSAYYSVLEPIRCGLYFKNRNYRIINRQMRLLIRKTIQLEKARSVIFFSRIIGFHLRHQAYPSIKQRLSWRWRAIKRRLWAIRARVFRPSRERGR